MEESIKIKDYKDEEILEYNLAKEFYNLNGDYRNSNYKIVKIFFEEMNKFIYLKQDYKIGKGGILWDGVILIIFY